MRGNERAQEHKIAIHEHAATSEVGVEGAAAAEAGDLPVGGLHLTNVYLRASCLLEKNTTLVVQE